MIEKIINAISIALAYAAASYINENAVHEVWVLGPSFFISAVGWHAGAVLLFVGFVSVYGLSYNILSRMVKGSEKGDTYLWRPL